MNNSDNTCFLCGSKNIFCRKYLSSSGGGLVRNIGYAMPKILANFIQLFSKKFSNLYYPVKVNKKYFSRDAIYCCDCNTGWVDPNFSSEQLDNYYSEFYWKNRIRHEEERTLSSSLKFSSFEHSKSRLDFVFQNAKNISSVIDFGAGDCSASRVLISDYEITDITVVDKSIFSVEIAQSIGVKYCNSIEKSPVVDLVFSGHSIEHVHDLVRSMGMLVEKVRIGGYLFFETPNIANSEIFQKLSHTPHTYMLSIESFYKLGKLFGLEILSIEAVGPKWSKAFPFLDSDARADLRVLFKKTDVKLGEVF